MKDPIVDRKTLTMLALIAYKYGEISEGKCVDLTGMKREDIREEMYKKCGRFRPYDEASEEAALWRRRYEELAAMIGAQDRKP